MNEQFSRAEINDIDESIAIEFKEINPSDFEGYDVKNNTKTILNVSDSGYIYDSLKDTIDLEEKNTAVINAAVGQGKSYAVIKLAQEYYKSTEVGYKVFIVVPFKDLIDQYSSKLIEDGIPKERILDYRELGQDSRRDLNAPFFHLITINSLLGNYGENAVSQSRLKRNYLNNLKNHCRRNGYKAIFFIDEVHDSIKNFKEIFILNLIKWRPVAHKVFVSSATFNETSKIVIKYLAELTDYKLELIESTRSRIENKTSRLHLFYENQYQYKSDNNKIIALIDSELKKGKKPQILTSTKRTARSFFNAKSPISELIKSYGFDLNLCVGDSKSKFNSEKCNIGTAFKTGRSIEDENTAYFIFMPGFLDKVSIFFDGINSIIQSLARPRVSCDIYIILPFPDKLIKSITPENNYLKHLKQIRGKNFYNNGYELDYHNINEQDNLIEEFYNRQKQNFDEETSFLENTDRTNKPRIEFPPLEIFSLEYAEKYLAYEFEIFGSDIPAYITWASFNNQFYNCKLKSICYSNFVNFNKGKVQEELEEFYYGNYGLNSSFFTLNSDIYCYEEFRNKLFENLVYYTDEKGVSKKQTNNLKGSFNRQILAFIQRKKTSINWYFRDMFYSNSSSLEGLRDYEFSLEDYVRASISVSINTDYKFLDDKQTELKFLYSQLYEVKGFFKDKLVFIDVNGKHFMLLDNAIYKYKLIREEIYSKLYNTILALKEKDDNLKMFSFFQKLDGSDVEKTTKRIYSFFRKIFYAFEDVDARINSKQFPDEDKGKTIKREFEFDNEASLNLIYEPEDAWLYQSTNQIKERWMIESESGTYLPYKGYKDVEWGFNPPKDKFDISLVINSSANIEDDADITEIDEEE